MPTLVSKESLLRLAEQVSLAPQEQQEMDAAIKAKDEKAISALYYTLRRKHPSVIQHKKQSISHTL